MSNEEANVKIDKELLEESLSWTKDNIANLQGLETPKEKENNSLATTLVWLMISVEILFVSVLFGVELTLGKVLSGKSAMTLALIIFAAIDIIVSILILIKRNSESKLVALTQRALVIIGGVAIIVILLVPMILFS